MSNQAFTEVSTRETSDASLILIHRSLAFVSVYRPVEINEYKLVLDEGREECILLTTTIEQVTHL
jgi:hypothetical protein